MKMIALVSGLVSASVCFVIGMAFVLLLELVFCAPFGVKMEEEALSNLLGAVFLASCAIGAGSALFVLVKGKLVGMPG